MTRNRSIVGHSLVSPTVVGISFFHRAILLGQLGELVVRRCCDCFSHFGAVYKSTDSTQLHPLRQSTTVFFELAASLHRFIIIL